MHVSVNYAVTPTLSNDGACPPKGSLVDILGALAPGNLANLISCHAGLMIRVLSSQAKNSPGTKAKTILGEIWPMRVSIRPIFEDEDSLIADSVFRLKSQGRDLCLLQQRLKWPVATEMARGRLSGQGLKAAQQPRRYQDCIHGRPCSPRDGKHTVELDSVQNVCNQGQTVAGLNPGS
jgi:hypothetical protein